MITVTQGQAPGNEHPAIEVHSYRSPRDHSTTISQVLAYETDGTGLRITTVVATQPMPHEEALVRAKQFAEKVGWSRVYARNDSQTTASAGAQVTTSSNAKPSLPESGPPFATTVTGSNTKYTTRSPRSSVGDSLQRNLD